MAASEANSADGKQSSNDVRLFWACFISLIATAFGFVVRGQVMGEWGEEFNLTESQKGQLFGVGLWPFAVSIVLFSLIIDRIGYGKTMVFAFACHFLSAIITIFATNYTMLYIGTFVCALGNGTVEAVVNPVVATMFSKEKTKWLNILHAGWPGGLVLGGILAIALGADTSWEIKVGLILIPTIVYGVMMLPLKFPVQERVQAGVSYLDMLKEAGVIGALIVVSLMVREIFTFLGTYDSMKFFGNIFVQIGTIIVIVGAYAAYVKSLGRPLFIFLLIIMMPLATTELGVDSWVTELMAPAMGKYAAWILIYTSAIMMVLRFFFAGPIVKKLTPLGLLAVSAVLAIIGLLALSKSAGIMILVAATLYGFGKSFFWPTMLGIVAEQFPKGGALTLNMIAGVGMLSVGILGGPLIGAMLDTNIDKELATQNAALHEEVTVTATGIFGEYKAVDKAKVEALSEEDAGTVVEIQNEAKKGALAKTAIFPAFMLLCYIALIFYFKSKGGYVAEQLH